MARRVRTIAPTTTPTIDDMRFAGVQFIEAIVRFQLLEDELDSPARRVDLRDGIGVERIGADVGEVESILSALGKSDRHQAQETACSASDSGIHSSLERHLSTSRTSR